MPAVAVAVDLNKGGIAILLNSYGSRGLVLRVLAREKNYLF
jgi:hypothetical protein